MILRPARPEDATAICAILNPIIRDTLVTFAQESRSAASVAEDIARRAPAYIVAERADRIVGFSTYGPFRSGVGYARTCEHTTYLAPDARGQGIGRKLLHHLERVAHAQSVHVLVAAISAANPGAIAFHERLGFAHVGRMPEVGFKQGRWLDLVLMQKGLDQGQDGAPDFGAAAL